MLVVVELDVGKMKLAAFLDVDLMRAVDHDVGYGFLAQQRVQWPEAEQLVFDLLHQAIAIDIGQQASIFAENIRNRGDDFRRNQRGLERFQLRDVDGLEQPVVNLDLG